jgi:hypothetical protein
MEMWEIGTAFGEIIIDQYIQKWGISEQIDERATT